MVIYAAYRPNPWSGKGDLISSKQDTVYYSKGDQALYHQTNTHLLGYHYELVGSYVNNTDSPYSEKVTTTTGTTVTHSTEFSENTSTSVGMSGSLQGLGFSFSTENGEDYKEFHSAEVNNTISKEQNITVAPNSQVYCYQQVFDLDVEEKYKLDAWNMMVMVGKEEGKVPATHHTTVAVHTNQFVLSREPLSGMGYIDVNTVEQVHEPMAVLPFGDCTGRCKDYMHDHGFQDLGRQLVA